MKIKFFIKYAQIIIFGLIIANFVVGSAQAVEFDKSSIGVSAHLYNWSNNLFPQYEDVTENFGVVRDGAWWHSLEEINLESDEWDGAYWSSTYFQTTLCTKLDYLSGYDTLVQRFQNTDSPELLLVLDLENKHFALVRDIGPGQDDIFYDYVDHVVERYDGDGYNDMPGLINPVKYYEIGNEPEYLWYIDNAYLTPEDYAKHRLIPGYKAAKAACEECVVMNAGLGMQGDGSGENIGHFTTDYLEQMYDAIIDYNNNDPDNNDGPGANNYYMDRVAIHYYSAENEISKNIDATNQIIQNKEEGKSKPIWITEFGSQTGCFAKGCIKGIKGIFSREEDQASILMRHLALMVANNVEKSIIYNLKDSSSTFEERMGLYKPTCQNSNVEVISPKVSLIAHNTMVTTLEGLDFEEILLESKPKTPPEDGTEDLYKVIFSNSDKKVTLLWFTKNDGTYLVDSNDWASEKTTVTIPVGFNDVRILQMDGSSSTPIIVNNNGINEVTLEVGERPIYLIEEKIEIAPLDLIFVIDTTGSMWDDIDQVKLASTVIVNAIDFIFKNNYRVAIVDYRDYPQYPYGQPGLDYDYNLNLPFSNDKTTIVNSINELSIGYGVDWRESVYSGLVKAMTDPNKDLSNSDNYGWRKGVNKAIILMGDAPPHNPEPWAGGYTLEDVAYWSENIDPVIVHSVTIGSSSDTFSAFSEISDSTGGKVYTSPTASEIVDTIIEVIGDIGDTPNLGVSIDIDPVINVASPENTVTYSIGITNTGTIADTYDISIDLENFASGYRGHPISIQESWTDFNRTSVEIEPDAIEMVTLTISVPNNWAGMEDVIYPFEVIAKSETDELISNTSTAELKVIAGKRSMVEYSRLETIWLSELVQSSSVDDEIKNSLLDKLTSATLKLDQSILKIEGGKYKQANNMLEASQNIINAFINQVEAQYDKKIMQPDAEMLMEEANRILQDIESAKNM